MAVQIQLRNDTAANWTAANPILAAGEMGVESDTRKAKFGNGTTAWNSLSYFPGSALSALSDVALSGATSGQILSYNGTSWVNAAAPASGFDNFMLMGA
jgi:hypothetical protein